MDQAKHNELALAARMIERLIRAGCTPDQAKTTVEHHGHRHIFEALRKDEGLLEELVRSAHRIEKELEEIEERLPQAAKSSTLAFKTPKGVLSMDITVHLNDPAPQEAVFTEFAGLGGTGQVVPATGVVAFKSSDPTIVSVDPATGQLAYLAVGTATISADDGGNLPATGTVTVTAPTAQSSTLTFVQPPAPAPSI
jgi:hypothetical protein